MKMNQKTAQDSAQQGNGFRISKWLPAYGHLYNINNVTIILGCTVIIKLLRRNYLQTGSSYDYNNISSPLPVYIYMFMQ